MNKTFETTQELIGKYINQHLWSDINPIGKIVGIKSKTTVLVKRVVAGPNKVRMEFVAGGFSGHCINNYNQEYDFTESNEITEVRLSKSYLKYNKISDHPIHHYDYNF